MSWVGLESSHHYLWVEQESEVILKMGMAKHLWLQTMWVGLFKVQLFSVPGKTI